MLHNIRYLLNVSRENDIVKSLEESEDYKIFKNSKNNKTFDRKQTRNQSFNSMTLTNYSVFSNDNIYPTTYRVTPLDLKQKVDNLDIEYEDLYNLYTSIINKKQFFHNIMMKYNFKQINLESLKEKYTKKVSEILTKNYKNVNEMIKSNSKIETFIKKFQNFNENITELKEIYEFDILNTNKEFYIKCKFLIDEIKSFIQIIFNMINDIKYSFSPDEESYSKLNLISEKLTNYSKFLMNIHSVTKDEHINILLKEVISIPENIDKTIFDEKIDSLNKLIHFAQFKQFYRENKTDFLRIKLDFQIANLFTFHSYENIEEIINILVEYIDSQKIKEKKSVHSKSLSHQGVLSGSFSKKTLIKDQRRSNNFLPSQAIVKTVNNDEDSLIIEQNLTNINPVSIKDKVSKSNILNKLYDSETAGKRSYIRILNENVGNIIKETRKNLKENYELIKKQNEIDKLSSEFLLYNNPRLNFNTLSNHTYNSFVKLMIKNQESMANKHKVKIKLKNISVQDK